MWRAGAELRRRMEGFVLQAGVFCSTGFEGFIDTAASQAVVCFVICVGEDADIGTDVRDAS